jgi:hypothetical protein
MKPGPKTKNMISLVGFLLGLSGIAYTLWILIVESDHQAIPLFVQSMMIIVGAYYLLIWDNDHYLPGTGTMVRDIFLVLFTLGIVSGLCFLNNTNGRYSGYFAGMAIFILVLFSPRTITNSGENGSNNPFLISGRFKNCFVTLCCYAASSFKFFRDLNFPCF